VALLTFVAKVITLENYNKDRYHLTSRSPLLSRRRIIALWLGGIIRGIPVEFGEVMISLEKLSQFSFERLWNQSFNALVL